MGLFTKIISGGAKEIIDTVSGVVDKFVTTPDEKAAIKIELEKEVNRHIEGMAAQAVELEKIEAANTADARSMNKEIQGDHPSWLAKNVSYIIDIFVMIVWGSMTIYIGLRALKLLQESKTVDFSVILGLYAAVSTQMGTVLNFHRGSSKGSEEKQKQIDRLTSTK